MTDSPILAAAKAMVLLGQQRRAEGKPLPSRLDEARAALEAGRDAMIEEPSYIAQCGDPMDAKQRFAWFQQRTHEATAAGCTWIRQGVHPDDDDLLLVEGWAVQPSDEGEPRWQMEKRCNQ